ncbi:MAG: CBS domain-containing protein [Burkholderiales bacterium]
MDITFRTLRELLAAKPPGALSIAPNASVYSALQLMADKKVGLLVVLDGEKLIGVISERDYARKVELRGKTAKDTTVRDVMTEKVVSVTPDNTVPECMALMNKHRIRHLPVVEGNRVIGVLSNRNLLEEVVAEEERRIKELEHERIEAIGDHGGAY